MFLKKKLPDAEFEIMKTIWRNPSPITTLEIMDKLDPRIKWKQQTVLTMLVRLAEKGFLQTSRVGRERNYTPAVKEEDYMQIEIEGFVDRYSGNSFGSLVKTLYDGQNLPEEEIDELKKWLESRG
ncbi:MAG: BlaI/MecI/CopY family transcriptional regulator [Defluviitaleaceae bacterium]|nr:BlaI/MecI/CopY family transcriptional regulator [Defluviitaleaceae bacterium]